MAAPDQVKKKFFETHKTDISEIIKRENAYRDKNMRPPLEEEEIDSAIDEMMSIVGSGGRIREFKFPPISAPPKDQPQDVPASPRPSSRSTTPAKAQPSNTINFQVLPCANGFLLYVDQNGETKQYIFKNHKELMEIFDATLFKTVIKNEDKPIDRKTFPKGNEGLPPIAESPMPAAKIKP